MHRLPESPETVLPLAITLLVLSIAFFGAVIILANRRLARVGAEAQEDEPDPYNIPDLRSRYNALTVEYNALVDSANEEITNLQQELSKAKQENL